MVRRPCATIVWWSGLTVREARTGIDLAKAVLVQGKVADHDYWWIEPAAPMPRPKLVAHLLPNYDEYLIAYKDREPVLGARAASGAGEELANQLVIDGRLAGSWKRTIDAGAVTVEVKPYARLPAAHVEALDAAVARYRRFFETPAAPVRARAAPGAGIS